MYRNYGSYLLKDFVVAVINVCTFHAMAEIKQNSAGKNLNVTNIDTKAVPLNRQIGLPLNRSFL